LKDNKLSQSRPIKDSRLLRIVGVFNAQERNDLLRFLSSGFTNDRNPEELIAFFNFIIPFYPSLDDPRLDKQNIYKTIYPKAKWVSGKFDKLMVRLLKVTYRFISIQFSQEYQNPIIAICSFLQDRSLQPVLDRVLKSWKKEQKQQTRIDSKILYERFVLTEFLATGQAEIINPKIKLELPEMILNLDQYYVCTKLKYACQLLAINTFVLPVDTKGSLKSFGNIDEMVNLPHLQLPIIKVYYQAYKLLTSDAEVETDYFDEFEKALDLYHESLPDDLQKVLTTLIRNYAIRQYHKGQKGYLKKAFDLYRDHISKGFLYYENTIRAQPFRNLVTFGLRLGEADWVYKFILEHEHRISGSKHPELVFNFNLALYYFHIKNYKKSLDLLPDYFDDTYFKVSSKRLELMIYSETNSQILDAKIDAFKVFIFRIPKSKITDKYKLANNNFIDMLKQIRHPKTVFNAARIQKLKSKMEQMDFLSEKDWLIGFLPD